jgi:hypothetical protein
MTTVGFFGRAFVLATVLAEAPVLGATFLLGAHGDTFTAVGFLWGVASFAIALVVMVALEDR